ncbi:hypothetical protein ALC60_04066, partial [Trachymyrmex zeteki]
LSEKMELTRENFRAMIYYDFRRGLLRQECIDQFTSTFGDKAPSFATVAMMHGVNVTIALHDHLAVKKVCSRWIPHNLTKSQKDAHVDWCKQVVRTHAKVYRS